MNQARSPTRCFTCCPKFAKLHACTVRIRAFRVRRALTQQGRDGNPRAVREASIRRARVGGRTAKITKISPPTRMVSHTISNRPSSQDGGAPGSSSCEGHGSFGCVHDWPGKHGSPACSGTHVEPQISVSSTDAQMTITPPTTKERISMTASVRTTVSGCMMEPQQSLGASCLVPRAQRPQARRRTARAPALGVKHAGRALFGGVGGAIHDQSSTSSRSSLEVHPALDHGADGVASCAQNSWRRGARCQTRRGSLSGPPAGHVACLRACAYVLQLVYPSLMGAAAAVVGRLNCSGHMSGLRGWVDWNELRTQAYEPASQGAKAHHAPAHKRRTAACS